MDEWINKVRYIHMCAVLSRSVLLTLWTATHQAPLSMGILQARILEWVVMPSSKGSRWPRNWTCISYVSCIGRQVLYHFLGIYPVKIVNWKYTCTPGFIVALFTIARIWKQPQCPSTEEWIKKTWYIYTTEYCSVMKKEQNNAICSNMDRPRDCRLNEVSQKDKHSMISLTCRI